MEDDETELRNPFPSPPSHYTRYTAHNLKLLTLLRERAGDDTTANQREVLSDQMEVPDWQLVQLEKPRVDWILDEPEAFYDVFGDRWFVRLCVAVISIHWRFPPGQRQHSFPRWCWWQPVISFWPSHWYRIWSLSIRCIDTCCSRPSTCPAIYITLAPRHVFYFDVIITFTASPESGGTSRVAKTYRLDI